MTLFGIHPVSILDTNKVTHFIVGLWDAEIVVGHDSIYKPSGLPGFIAYRKDNQEEWIGMITYCIKENL